MTAQMIAQMIAKMRGKTVSALGRTAVAVVLGFGLAWGGGCGRDTAGPSDPLDGGPPPVDGPAGTTDEVVIDATIDAVIDTSADAPVDVPADAPTLDTAPDTANEKHLGEDRDATSLPDVPFMRPDVAAPAASCGFEAPAFCETFEEGPTTPLGRAGELDPARWSVGRNTTDPAPTVLGVAFGVKPARLGACRPGLSDTVVLPDSDVVVCEPTSTIATRHLLSANGSQNYGVLSHRIRQPFDFAGRTGTVKVDVDLTGSPLCGFAAIAISADPTPAPSFNEWEHASGPRNGVEIVFNGDNCHTGGATVSPAMHFFKDYVETVVVPTDNDPATCARTADGALNHVEIDLTQTHLEVWVSDASPDGATFPNLHRVWQGEVALPFSRGYVNLSNHNHATIKYWCGNRNSQTQGKSGSASLIRWDNVGFDGPIVTGWQEASAPSSLTRLAGPTFSQGIEGCVTSSGGCEWRPDTISRFPDEGTARCGDPSTMQCRFAGEARSIGYVVPADGQPALALRIDGVHPAGAKSARLALGAWYPSLSEPGPPTALGLRHRLNGGPWHDRLINAAEANAFAAAQGAGILNQIIDLDPGELREGANALEVVSVGVKGGYPIGIVNIDLVLGGTP